MSAKLQNYFLSVCQFKKIKKRFTSLLNWRTTNLKSCKNQVHVTTKKVVGEKPIVSELVGVNSDDYEAIKRIGFTVKPKKKVG